MAAFESHAGSIPSTTTLKSSANPSIFGQAVTLTATVFPTAVAGTVTFYDGVSVLGVMSLSRLSPGQAALTTTLLPSGNRSLKAFYSGDVTYEASTSAALSQKVTALAQNGFQAAVNYGAGVEGNDLSVVVGDFNGDGRADLAVANSNQFGSSLMVLLGNGDGTFRQAVNSLVAGIPHSLAVGDFNGDGRTDIVVANGTNVSVLLSSGEGTFQTVNYNAGSNPDSVAVGDFNGDGWADIVVASDTGASLLLGNGDGTFQRAVNYDAGSNPYSVAVGDFNGDGRADIVVVNKAVNGVSVLLGNGDGTFQRAVYYSAGYSPISVAVGDFNGDGRPDIAVVCQYDDSNVSVLLGKGDGTFQPAVKYGSRYFSTSVAVGDFNGDGYADLAVTGFLGVSVLLGKGDGTFQPGVNYTAGNFPQSVAVGDFNGDGRADLAVANLFPPSVSVLLGVPSTLPTVLNKVTSNASGLNNGTCTVPPAVNTFTTAAPAAWIYFDVSGAAVGDSVRVDVRRPDGALYQSFPVLMLSSVGNNGYECISESLPISGTAAASYLGTWAIQAFWNNSALLTLNFTLASAVTQSTPVIYSNGIVNGAGFAQGPLAPGSIISIFGTTFAPGLSHNGAGATGLPLPTTINGARVLINGIAAPLFYVDSFQINAQVPWEVSGTSSVSVQVVSAGVGSNTATVALAPAAPGIFSATDGAVILHASDGTLVRSSNPATPGEYLTIYCTGLGAVTNRPATGAAAPSSPLAVTTTNPTGSIGGVQATTAFSGLAPGFVGLYQVNVQVPGNVPGGNDVAFVLRAGANSATVAIAVKSSGASAIQVSISPTSAAVQTTATQQFTATVTGATNSNVIWSVNGIVGGNSTVGTISTNGLYVAPTTVPSPNTFSVKATSAADSTKFAAATVTVTSGRTVPQLVGAFNFSGSYPIPAPVIYGNKSGRMITSHAYPGQIFLLVSPAAMDVTTATLLVKTNHGSVIAQIPSSGLYWVQVGVGTEAAFIAAVQTNPAVIFVGPNVPLTGAQAANIFGAAALDPLLPTVGGLIAQFDLFPTAAPASVEVCGVSHGEAGERILTQNGQTENAYDLDQLQGGTNPIAFGQKLYELADASDFGFGMARAAEGALQLRQKLIVNMSLQALGQPNDGQDRSVCETNSNDPVCSKAGVDGNYESWKTDEFSFLVGVASALHYMRDDLRDNTLLVISAGNSGLDLTREIRLLETFLPKAFTHMLIVGSTGVNGQPFFGHNHSTDPAAMLYAPGVGVTIPGTGGCKDDGTSFAAPQVANLAAQLAQRFPNLTTAQLVQAIMIAARLRPVKGLPTMPTLDQVVAVIQTPPRQFTLTVAKPGLGSGTVTSLPLGIDCGVTCAATFLPGTSLTLTALAGSDSTFVGWSGPSGPNGEGFSCLGTGDCTIVMNQDQTILATFSKTGTLSGLTLSQNTVVSGASLTGTATLTAPAGSGGVAVQLQADSPAARVPAILQVPAGQTSATFPINTTAVTTQTIVNISATLGSVVRTAVLTLNPPAGSGITFVSATTIQCASNGTGITCAGSVTLNINLALPVGTTIVVATTDLLVGTAVTTQSPPGAMTFAIQHKGLSCVGTQTTIAVFSGSLDGQLLAGLTGLNISSVCSGPPAQTVFSGPFSGSFGAVSTCGCGYNVSISGQITLTLVRNVDGSLSGSGSVPATIGIVVVSGDSCTASPFSITASGSVSGTDTSLGGTFVSGPLMINFKGSLSGNSISGSATVNETLHGSCGTSVSVSASVPSIVLTKQ